mgnify:CR=1 FL=1
MVNGNYRCPECSYGLIFLEASRKYKCALCGKVFLSKFIENKSFRTWNKKQRELEIHNLDLEDKKKKQDFSEIKLFMAFRRLFTKEERKIRTRENAKRWRLKNREKVKAKKKRYYEKNRDKIIEYYETNKSKILKRAKIYNQLIKERHNKWKKEYYYKNKDKMSLASRINYLRRKQAKRAIEELKKGNFPDEDFL